MPDTNNLLFRRKEHVPASIILDDLRAGCIPTEYFRSLVKGGIAASTVRDLKPTKLSDGLAKQLSWFIGQDRQRSVWLDDPIDFRIAATEFILCGIGTIGFLTPASIALNQIRNTLRGAESVLSLVEEMDFVFIDDMDTQHTKRLFDAEPTAAAHFHEFLRFCKYGLQTRFIYCLTDTLPNKVNSSLSEVYTDSLVDIITSDLCYIGGRK